MRRQRSRRPARRTVFTTHTPGRRRQRQLPAGAGRAGDRGGSPRELAVPRPDVIALGRTDPGDPEQPFGVTQAALRMSRAANAVSRRHGEVAREMWAPLWPDRDPDAVPIGYVTNGVHVPTWIGGADARAARPPPRRGLDGAGDRSGRRGRRSSRSPTRSCGRPASASARSWSSSFARRSTQNRLLRGDSREYVDAAARAFDPGVLTIGFARRVATYKRLELLTRDPEWTLSLLGGERPVQVVLAGKAHPRDEEAKRSLQRLFGLQVCADRRRAGRVPRRLRPRDRRRPGAGLRRVAEPAAAAAGGQRDQRDEVGDQRRAPAERAGRVVGRGLRRRERLGAARRRRRRPLRPRTSATRWSCTAARREVVPAFYDRDATGLAASLDPAHAGFAAGHLGRDSARPDARRVRRGPVPRGAAQRPAGSARNFDSGRGGGPTYLAVGRISRPSRFCSMMWADQPAVRAHVNIGVNSSGGTSAKSSTTADQNSTLVASTRSGLRACSSASAACSSASATSTRGAPISLGRAAQHARPRVLGPVHAVPEAHQPLAAVEQVLDVALGVAHLRHLVEHLQHTGRGAAVQRAGQRADRGAERGGDVGAGRGHDSRGEGRRVHPVLGGRDPVGVDRLRRAWGRPRRASGSGSARGSSVALSTSRWGTGGWPIPRADCATNDSAITDARARLSRASSSEMSISWPKPHCGAEHRQRRLDVDPGVAGADAQRVGLGRRQARLQLAVDEQAPDLLERDLAHQLLDVDAAVAQRAARPVGLGDLGREGDYALEA